MKKDLRFAVVIPAHNEELVIRATIASVLSEVNRKDVYMVDDGSTDGTYQLAVKFLGARNVLKIKNGGKAKALNMVMEKFGILAKYDLVMIHDADTRMVAGFVREIKKVFIADTNKKIVCVMGHVLAQPKNWLTAYRVWEYELGQAVYKQAQSYINGVTVCPGCSSVYRVRVLAKLGMPQGTMTEDMDLTFSIHRGNWGKMVYVPKAMMVTQDPANLGDFYRQIHRWYRGFWQCVFKHNVPWGGQILDAEISLMAIEGLLQPFLVLLTWGIAWWGWKSQNYLLALIPLGLDLGLFMMPTMMWAIWRRGTWKIIRWIGHFYMLRILGSFVFMKSFFEIAVLGSNSVRNHLWTTRRYSVDNKALPDWLKSRIKVRSNS